MTRAKSASNMTFKSWAFSTAEKLRKAAGIGIILAAAFSINFLRPQEWPTLNTSAELTAFIDKLGPARATLAVIQAGACLLLALLTPLASLTVLRRRAVNKRFNDKTAQKACLRIILLVLAIYLAWSLYYLVTGLSITFSKTRFDQAISVTLNTIPSVLLFWLYIEMAEFTVDGEDPDSREGGKDQPEVIELSTGKAARHRLISLGIFVLTVAPVWAASGRSPLDERATFIKNTFDVLTSCLNGVAIALVVGRLGSKVIDLGSLTLGLLYFYAVIQPTAASFHNTPAVHLFATTVALPLKVLLWLVFVWTFTSGILSDYVREIRDDLTDEYKGRRGKVK